MLQLTKIKSTSSYLSAGVAALLDLFIIFILRLVLQYKTVEPDKHKTNVD